MWARNSSKQGNTEVPGEILSKRRRETTKSSLIWRRVLNWTHLHWWKAITNFGRILIVILYGAYYYYYSFWRLRAVNSVISNSQFQTTGMCKCWNKLARVNPLTAWVVPMRLLALVHYFSLIITSVLGKLRMRKQNTKITVPLDAVPERRTERCSPRFRLGGRFCELRFRYQSSPTGSEGEISRPLDHRWQIPFIHSTQFTPSSKFYVYNTAF